MDVILELDWRFLASWKPEKMQERKEECMSTRLYHAPAKIMGVLFLIYYYGMLVGQRKTHRALRVHHPCSVRSRQRSWKEKILWLPSVMVCWMA